MPYNNFCVDKIFVITFFKGGQDFILHVSLIYPFYHYFKNILKNESLDNQNRKIMFGF